eukprot:15348049-Ditylum_brightwellii.AAC.1
MYGLPQAGILANKLFTVRLAKRGYYPVQHTPVLWQHKWRPVTFALVVDDFGVKIRGEEHGKHLINALKEHYEDYTKRHVDLAMPGYIAKARTNYGHTLPKCPQHEPHKHVLIQYSAKNQWVEEDLTELPKQIEIKQIQDIVGTL